VHTICVVGLGPRGLSVLERLCSNAAAGHQRIVVHVVDPHLDVGGRVWRTSQPGVLLMNTVASQVTMFTDDSVSCDGPVRTGPSLFEWAKLFVPTEPFGPYPAWVYAEAEVLGPDSYPTRAFYGHYLRWVFERLDRFVPDLVTVRRHPTTAVALADSDGGRQRVVLADGTVLDGLDAVVLALGHLDQRAAVDETAYSSYAERHDLVYVPTGNPAEAHLDAIRPGAPVALRGLGLNYFDYQALLTVGRGGRYERGDDGLTYEPSGREPLLVAGSRRGVPYHSRGANQKGVTGRHLPLFLTAEVIKGLRARVEASQDDGASAVRFMTDVWPLVDREVRAVYHHTLLAGRGDLAVAEEFLREYVGLPDAAADDQLLARFEISAAERWDWERIARPAGDRRFTGPDDYQAWLLAHLRSDLDEARQGNVRGPLKAALDVMRDIRNEVRLVVDHGGLAGSSYREELEGWYTPLNAFVSIGPPPSRIEEMVALIEAGVLRVSGPGMRVAADPRGAGWMVTSDVPGDEVMVTALVEARLHEVDIRQTTDPLIASLLAHGECTTYRIPDPDADYRTGGLAVTPKPYRIVDAAGRAHPRRYAFGVPTEPVHWGTAAGVRPGVDSVILGDADAIARAALSVVDVGGLDDARSSLLDHPGGRAASASERRRDHTDGARQGAQT